MALEWGYEWTFRLPQENKSIYFIGWDKLVLQHATNDNWQHPTSYWSLSRLELYITCNRFDIFHILGPVLRTNCVFDSSNTTEKLCHISIFWGIGNWYRYEYKYNAHIYFLTQWNKNKEHGMTCVIDTWT